MSYKKCFAKSLGKNKFKIHLWDEAGYDEIEWWNPAYVKTQKVNLRGLMEKN